MIFSLYIKSIVGPSYPWNMTRIYDKKNTVHHIVDKKTLHFHVNDNDIV